MNPDPEDPSLNASREERFMTLLKGYLEGIGHPAGALSVSQAAAREAKDDALLRANLFLEAVTASVILPWAHEHISVCRPNRLHAVYLNGVFRSISHPICQRRLLVHV